LQWRVNLVLQLPAMDTDPGVRNLLAGLDAEQWRLRRLLEGLDAASLAQRPPSGKWSILENVQHLVFAEWAHLGQFTPVPHNWAEYGLVEVLPRNLKQLRLDSTGDGSMDGLVDAWLASHASLVPHLAERDSPEFRRHLSRHITHQRTHIKEVERLLRGKR
jgi:hypothetical protein